MAENEIVAAGALKDISDYLAPTSSGVALSNVAFQGVLSAVGTYDSLDLGPDVKLSRGILLTSGAGTPARTNLASGYSVSNGALGNGDLSGFAKAAFSNAGTTRDASVLTLTFTITDPSIRSLAFNVAFGSEEYPEYSDTSFVDIAAVWTGTGTETTNYALINGDPTTPLSVVSKNLALGNFIDNRDGALSIEYDGFVNRQTIIVPVSQGENVIRLGVADTGDYILDSGLFVFGITGLGSDVGGTFQEVEVSEGGEYDGGGGNYIFTGSASSFDGTVLSDLDEEDQILIEGSTAGPADVRLGVGSIVLRIDSDGDGLIDTRLTLADPVFNATVNVAVTEDGTSVTLDALAASTNGNDEISGSVGLDYISGGLGDDMLSGLAGSDALSGGAGRDLLSGGAGDDWLEGGRDNDELAGGSGADVFFFKTDEKTGKDRILDFGADDILVTDKALFDSNRDGIVSFGGNRVLDIAGGDQVLVTDVGGNRIQRLEFDGSYVEAATGKAFYVYSLVGSSAGVSTLTTVGGFEPV